MAFFYQLERKKGETMTEWIARRVRGYGRPHELSNVSKGNMGNRKCLVKKTGRTLGPATVEQVKETQDVRKCLSVMMAY
jgi:hypothetical protein